MFKEWGDEIRETGWGTVLKNFRSRTTELIFHHGGVSEPQFCGGRNGPHTELGKSRLTGVRGEHNTKLVNKNTRRNCVSGAHKYPPLHPTLHLRGPGTAPLRPAGGAQVVQRAKKSSEGHP